MLWQAVMFGPDDTPWEGGTFNLLMEFGEDYPNKPPKVRFACNIFHPNVYGDGQICLDILGSNWSPIYDVAAVLTSIQVGVGCARVYVRGCPARVCAPSQAKKGQPTPPSPHPTPTPPVAPLRPQPGVAGK
jgi:hypothetical protein